MHATTLTRDEYLQFALQHGRHPEAEERPLATTCQHLGEQLRLQSCQTCSGNVRLKVFACAIHSECQLTPRVAGVRACEGCCDFTPLERSHAVTERA